MIRSLILSAFLVGGAAFADATPPTGTDTKKPAPQKPEAKVGKQRNPDLVRPPGVPRQRRVEPVDKAPAPEAPKVGTMKIGKTRGITPAPERLDETPPATDGQAAPPKPARSRPEHGAPPTP